MYPLLVSLHSFSDYGLLVLRLVLAAIFWVHGRSKAGSWKGPAGPMSGMMKLLSICEPLGAIGVATGFLTQFAALGFCLIMCGATYLKITAWKTPFFAHDKTGWELDVLILASSLLLVIMGAGAFSLDRIWLGL